LEEKSPKTKKYLKKYLNEYMKKYLYVFIFIKICRNSAGLTANIASKCIFIIRLKKAGDLIMGKKKTVLEAADEIFSFDYVEDEEDGFCENIEHVGEVVASFSFDDNTAKIETPEKLTDNRRLQKQPYGIDPLIELPLT
jgi:hypothetical protein